jgi:hypothetical protein
MNKIQIILSNRNKLSSLVVGLFIINVLAILFWAEINKHNQQNKQYEFENKNLISPKYLSTVKKIELKNRNDEFIIEKQDDKTWQMIKPRNIVVTQNLLDRLTGTFTNIRIIQNHLKEPTNLQSFALDPAQVHFTLTANNEEKVELQIGITNPIDNTTYITVSNRKYIYQVEQLNEQFTNYTISNFVDGSVFSPDYRDVQHISFFYAQNKTASLSLNYQERMWESQQFKSLSQTAIKDSLQSLLSLSSKFILDSQSDEQKNLIENYLVNPLYQINIKTFDGKEIQYKISNLINSLPDIKFEKKAYFIVKASDRSYYYLYDKAYLNNFFMRYQDIKP